jgi:hypothetical protein
MMQVSSKSAQQLASGCHHRLCASARIDRREIMQVGAQLEVVNKMISAYRAPINAKDTPAVVEYLTRTGAK